MNTSQLIEHLREVDPEGNRLVVMPFWDGDGFEQICGAALVDVRKVTDIDSSVTMPSYYDATIELTRGGVPTEGETLQVVGVCGSNIG
jgi:hypothetical protein